MKRRGHNTRFTRWSVVLVISLAACLLAPSADAAPTAVPLLGEIERITLDNAADHYSGGKMVVGGQFVILPKNLLLDLPANRLTLKQLFDQAPAACVARGESGLAKADACNRSGAGGFAILSANRSDAGNVIAGDVFLQKGQESVTGVVTFINFNQGYYRLSGQPGVDNAGVIVRLNDPTARHSVQTGLGCNGGPNCSADPRFTLDPDNYTNGFTNGLPYCLPSTVLRTFDNSILGGSPGATAQADVNGNNDYLCPDTNRPTDLITPIPDSRRFAPLKVGDSVTAEGNFETINGVTFLSAHTSTIGVAPLTATTAGQPDYFTLAEVFMDAPAFFNQRYRTLIIGYGTLFNTTDVLFWTIHRDKVDNAIHEVPWTSVLGCDNANQPGTCASVGLAGAGAQIFRIRHDIDFLRANPNPPGGPANPQRFGGADTKQSLCAHLRGETRFGNTTPFCPSAPSNPFGADGTGSLAEEFGVFSPIPHEIIGRTGRKVADAAGAIRNIDVSGNEATWGTYLFPFGVNLGGISLQEMNEINLNLIATPHVFEGIPWNLDRRLGPGGCNGPCEADTGNPYAYALDPFPYSGLHPATALDTVVGPIVGGGGGLPTGPYNDPNFTASPLSNVQNRMFSFVDNTLGIFNGNFTVIDNTLGGTLIPPAFPILPTPPLPLPAPGVLTRPVTDFDGDGKADFVVWRPGTGVWYILRSSDGGVTTQQWGSSVDNDVLVPGDYDGDGKADFAVWRPATGDWLVKRSSDGGVTSQQWGLGSVGDIPVPGDYDNDGKTDFAVWRAPTGTWYILRSSDGAFTVTQWGSGDLSDVPLH